MQVLDGLLVRLRTVCDGFTDRRSTSKNVVYSMADIGMSAFAMFFMQSESFLDFQRKVEQRERRSNLHRLFGVKAIPTDPHIRSMLDEVEPEQLQSGFDDVVRTLEREGGLETFACLDGRVLVALDGTEYFCSKKISCDHCLKRNRRDATVDYYHSMLAATVVAPGVAQAVHLMPEFIETLDGNEKQDCEPNAAKRWLASEKSTAITAFRPVFLGDALFACQPMAQAVKAVDGADFVFVVKPEYHKALFEAVENATVETLSVPGPKGVSTTYRWATGVPLRNSKDATTVDFYEITMTNASGKVTYRSAFATSLDVNESNVVEIVQCGRTRWKIENESFNVLKNHGYNLAHSFGHGKFHLAKMFAALNLLAFSFHGVCDILDDIWKRTRKKTGKRTSFFNEILYVCNYFIFENWIELFELILLKKAPASLRTATAGP